MKSPVLTAFLGWALLSVPSQGTILLNEIHINPPPDLDTNFEYIELRSTTGGVEACTGLTLLVIENNGGQVGQVEEAFNLDSFSTGANGLLILGNGYDSSPQGGPWSGFKAPATAAYDPAGSAPWSGMGDDDLDPNGGLTFLLVSGWTGLTNAGANLGDVDINNNSILDWLENPRPAGGQATQPYTALIDSIGYRDLGNSPVRLPYTSADLNIRPGSAANFAPDNISRRLSRANHPADANNASAWYGGNLAGTSPNAVAYDVQFFGDFKGQATPGQPNLDAVPLVGDFLINEVSINPPGTLDGNYEYIELINAAEGGGSASLQGLALLIIRSNDNDGPTSLGTIREAWDLSTFSTGANSLLLLGNGYPEGDNPWAGYVEPETQLAEPSAPQLQNPVRWSSMGDDDIASSNGFTVLLVQNFTGTVDQDLDSNNDGVLDVTPWTAIKDSVGFDQLAPGAGKTYAQAKIVPGVPYDIDNLSRKLGNKSANSAAAWYGGDYGANSSFAIGFQDETPRPAIGGFRGAATPGRTNLNSAAVAAPIRINEIQVNPVKSPDGIHEYIEFINAEQTIGGMSGLTLVFADGSPGDQNGRILEAINLSGLSTGPNGLLLMGDAYDNSTPYDAVSQQTSPLTANEDPAGLDTDDIGPNNAMLALLTKGAPPAVGSNVSAIPAADIVDSIGFGTSPNPAIPLLNTTFTPHNLSRYPGNVASSSAAAWYAGELDASLGDSSLAYGANFAGDYKGGGSPGRYNHAATPSPTANLVINEININPPGGDETAEFVEFRAVPGSAISTNGYTLLMLDSTGNDTGTVVEAWDLDGLATGTNGLLLIGAGYPASSPWIGAAAPAAGTRLGAPQFMAPGDIAKDSDNGAVSFLLVRNFAERAGVDLDDGAPVTGAGANDGNLDIKPWSGDVLDSAAMRLWDTSLTPSTWSGRIYAPQADLSQAGYTPDNIARQGNSTTPNNKNSWYGGDILGNTPIAVAYDDLQKFPVGFAGTVTAGHPNVGAGPDDFSDDDKDGVVYLIESALNMNPAASDAEKLPMVGLTDIGGTSYPALTYTRFLNGTGGGAVHTANGYRYEVEASTDLINWNNLTTLVSVAPNSDGLTENAVFRPDTAFFNTALSSGGRVFLRLKISRV